MGWTYLGLLGSIVVILVGAELFTNGIEWFGRHLNLGDGAVGSILAAIGTALPETIIPILAIAFGASAEAQAIGIGAIIGSSFMLATLAMLVTGAAVAIFAHRGNRSIAVNADPTIISRDLRFFLIASGATLIAALIGLRVIELVVAFALIVTYGFYVYRTISGDEASGHHLRWLYLQPKADIPHIAAVIAQLVIALIIIVVGARFFVSAIETIATNLALPALVLSLLITPFATELPEKLNSVTWIHQGKDTLALGNITGAMIFQASVLPAIGILLTPWQLTTEALIAAALGLVSAVYILIRLRSDHVLRFGDLMGVGFIYFAYAVYVLTIPS